MGSIYNSVIFENIKIYNSSARLGGLMYFEKYNNITIINSEKLLLEALT